MGKSKNFSIPEFSNFRISVFPNYSQLSEIPNFQIFELPNSEFSNLPNFKFTEFTKNAKERMLRKQTNSSAVHMPRAHTFQMTDFIQQYPSEE